MSHSQKPESMKHRRPKSNPPTDWAQPTSVITKTWIKNHRTEVTSAVASLVGTVAGYPLDTIKVNIQKYDHTKIRPANTIDLPQKPAYVRYSAWACSKDIYKDGGFIGFYRGVLPPLFSVCLVRVITFTAYQRTKYRFDDFFFKHTGVSPLQKCNQKWAKPDLPIFTTFGCAGALAGGLSVFVSCPFELTKVAAQVSRSLDKPVEGKLNPLDAEVRASFRGKGTLGVMGALVKNRGWSGLYCGIGYQMARDIVGTACYFGAYEVFKMRFSVQRGKPADDQLAISLAGGLAGAISHSINYPIDKVKTRYQVNCLSHHKSRTVRPPVDFFNREGWRGFSVGLTRAMVTSAVLFLTFERVKKAVNMLAVD
ncbi:mitochondrial carrier, partial [Tothia fuscella]